MIETTDSIIGSPEDKSPITTRVVQGDHTGLGGETIHLEVVKTAGDAEGFGIDGSSTSLDKTTQGNGYIPETFFHYGKGYGEFEITVQWMRGGKVIDEEKIKAISPLYHEFQRIAYQVSKEALDEARKMVASGSASTESSVAKVTGEKQDELDDLQHQKSQQDRSQWHRIEF